VCAVLDFPVSTYYAVKKREREPSARDVRDEQLKEQIMRVENRRKGRKLYGARKVWLQLRREGIEAARCTVERLMRELGIAGVSAQRKKPRTTVPDAGAGRPGDLLERDFSAPAPNRRWVADITYVPTACGFVYTAFVTDLFSRKIVGWQVADHLRAGLALDALEMAIFARRDGISDELVHHSGRGVQPSTPRSAIPSGWPISARSARSAAKATPTITRRRRRSIHFTRKSSSTARGHGRMPGR
jgi:putative transposase